MCWRIFTATPTFTITPTTSIAITVMTADNSQRFSISDIGYLDLDTPTLMRMCYKETTRPISKLPISGVQIRAPRALLNWSVREASARCNVSQSAISRCEKVDDIPPMLARNLNAIRRTLEQHGIEFLDLNCCGCCRNYRVNRPLLVTEQPSPALTHDKIIRCEPRGAREQSGGATPTADPCMGSMVFMKFL